MKISGLVWRNLLYFRRTNLAIVAGVAIATAVLSGALLVGQSVRGSLRQLLFQRIGSVEYAVSSDSFFRESLAASFEPDFAICPIIHLTGIVEHERTRVRLHHVNVYGVDERFWKFHGLQDRQPSSDRDAFAGEPLVRQLDLQPGDALLVRVETQQAIPREWLYGRRENVGRTIRFNFSGRVSESNIGEFSLRPSQEKIFSIFVPIRRLQRDLAQDSAVNTILLSGRNSASGLHSIQRTLGRNISLGDLGLKLRSIGQEKGYSLESRRIILDDSTVGAAIKAAENAGLQFSLIYAYLANSIRLKGREIPYSVITAADLGAGDLTSVSRPQFSASSDDSIWLTDWAARNLKAAPGDPVEIDYYLWQQAGQLITRTARFRLAGIVPMGGGVDASFAPEIPGITEARSISAWDPPFPLDLGRIREEDEEFWNKYNATPKAFVTLNQGQILWQSRFGKATALRFAVPEGMSPEAARTLFTERLLGDLDPEKNGFAISPVREQGLAASRGSTDFGEYFAYFSSFLIAAAILLSVLFFKLMVEQRVREIGLLRASGFNARTVRRMLLLEAALLSILGSVLGLFAALGYCWLIIAGLRTWWVDAVGTDRLRLEIVWTQAGIGAAACILFSLAAIVWSLRGLKSHSPRMLLAGVLESKATGSGRARKYAYAALVCLFSATGLIVASAMNKVGDLPGFFGSGFLLLASLICLTAVFLRRQNPRPLAGTGWPAMLRLGIRSAVYRPGRSLICASLIASATFIIFSTEAFRLNPQSISLDPASGTGGYPLVAESALPVIHDLNSPDGREAAGIAESESFNGLRFVSFRERPGDDASCLNLYAPQEPRILGAPHGFIDEARFSFRASIASETPGRLNPWQLLEMPSTDGTIPAIADANTAQYILHRSVGEELTIRAGNGAPVRLKLVAALRDSIFQGELVISESNFLKLFPEHEGFRFFLIDLPAGSEAAAGKDLQESLSDWGFTVESTQERLSRYHRVENTYLSTFQSLGALGLILGTIGLGTILLRNALERRRELALLRAVGYSRKALAGIVLAENAALICWGLASGAICAFLAVAPAIQSRGASFPFGVSALILAGVLFSGILSSAAAVVAVLRSPLLASLQSE